MEPALYIVMELIVVFMLNYCGIDNWQCYDHFNNCVVNKSVKVTQDNIDECVVEYEK